MPRCQSRGNAAGTPSPARPPARKRRFLSFPDVCPEPVLANVRLVENMALKKTSSRLYCPELGVVGRRVLPLVVHVPREPFARVESRVHINEDVILDNHIARAVHEPAQVRTCRKQEEAT